MKKSTAQGRYFIQTTPQASPAKCGICGYSGSERLYLDPRLDFEYYGSLIFCSECVMSMAQMFGFIEPAQAQALEARVEEAERELITLRAATQNLENLSVSLNALGFSRSDASASNLAGDDSAGADKLPEDPTLPFGESESGTSEPADESGPDDVRDVVHSFDPFADIRP